MILEGLIALIANFNQLNLRNDTGFLWENFCIIERIKFNEYHKNYKQIKRSIHQLVAETFIPNPDNYTEIDHIDRNKLNNHYTNLRWVSRFENASEPNHKSYTITDTLTGQVWKGYNLRSWAKDHYDFVYSRMKNKNLPINKIASTLSAARRKKTKIWNLVVDY